MMKFKKDVVATLATVAAVLVALFAIFVTIPVWFEAVVITLAVVGAFITVNEIVKARKASYDETTGKYTYKFPVREIVFGTLILVSIAAIVLLSLKRLFGFALIPVAVLLAILLVIALLKKLRIMQIVVGLILALLVVALIGYFTSELVHDGVNLNPGVSVETTTPEVDETKPEDGKTDETKPEDGKTDDTKPEDGKTDETKPEDGKTDETKPEDGKTDETKPEDDKVFATAVINAPETISFGELITITVENIKIENLKFSNEEFIFVNVVNANEIDVTLMGIVDDNGNVIFAPASGYITVTDSASGVYASIEVVDADDTTEPEIQVPEIEDNDEDVIEDTPVEDVTKPEIDTEEQTPDVEEIIPAIAKINAPKTMSYAEPITITLEGISAHDLIYGNEDFLYVEIITETEVEITLVGIVNENGVVEFIPASGYITVTDSVSGVYASIEIVNVPEFTTPEEQMPEIENNDEVIEDKPVEEITKPEDEPDVQEPEIEVVPTVVKINAPATIKYAEPITITLEGVKAEDLRFGNEDFLYVEIISETEVEVTLIGIVNDAGEVELVPAAGYITVTDAVSGVHVVIEIAE